MNIYKVIFKDWIYDEYASFVVAAESAYGAEQLVKKYTPYSEAIESITLLGTSNSEIECIILDSYKAG